jgi:glycosyltransferase involved in cell wall biosynthesis
VTSRLVLYAPNVHTGGGLVLLQALLAAWPIHVALTAFLDDRVREELNPPHDAEVAWVTASVGSRLAGELALRRVATRDTLVLCFHGLPPLLPNAARVVVFQQNRNYFGLNALSQFSFKTRLRLGLERLVSRTFRDHVSQYIVQTPSMQRILQHWFSASGCTAPRVMVLPFVDALSNSVANASVQREWDFVYVADGEAHKNHRNLLQAWRLLAQENLKPSLALTLSPRDEVLKQEVTSANEEGVLNIRDLGKMSRAEVLRLYANARALIFPSTSESFGLPLIEASQLGLPILASELDYVRDVCVPAETFDPNSPVSIARAVKRFLGCPEPSVSLKTPAEFWCELLQGERT